MNVSTSNAPSVSFSSSPRLTIWGSCVSRDMFQYVLPQFRPELYVARQSFISADNKVAPPPIKHGLDSKFQARLLEGDFAGNALESIINSAPEVLLLDLVDERLGVLAHEDGFITRSKELLSSTWWNEVKSADWIKFGSMRHFNLWKPRAELIINLLRSELPDTRIYAFDVPFALRDLLEKHTSPSLGRTASSWNRQYRKYFKTLSKQLEIITISPTDAIAHPNHKWGPAPFHYVQSTYEKMFAELDKRLARA